MKITPLVPPHSNALFALTKQIYKRLKPTSAPDSRQDDAAWASAHQQARKELGL